MTDFERVKISELPVVDSLVGDELVPVVQGGVDKRTTPDALGIFAPAGPTGPAGVSNVGVDLWSLGGDTPETVTDWAPILNTAMDNGAKDVLLRDKDYPYTTPLNFNDTRSVTVEGSGRVWPNLNGNQPASRLLWKGTGSGNAITANGADGLTFRGVGLCYDSASFTGRLFSARAGGGAFCAALHIDDCFVGSVSSAIGTVAALLALGGTVGAKVSDSSLFGGQHLVRGIDQAGDLSNAVYFDNCQLGVFKLAAFVNIGLQWKIENCTLEFNDGSSASAGIDSDLTCLSQFSVRDSGFWDQGSSTQVPVRQNAANTWLGVEFQGNYFDVFNAKHFLLNGPASVLKITGNTFSASIPGQAPILIDLGSPSTALKKSVNITDNAISASSYVDTAIINVAGHEDVTIEGTGQLSPVRQLRTIGGQERLGYVSDASFRPQITTHSGQTLGVCEIFGTDVAGHIIIRTGVSATTPGLVLDVALSATGIPYPSSVPSTSKLPAIQLTPVAIADSGSSGEAAVDAGAYVQLTSSQRNGFQIGTRNAIPGVTTIAYAYRVIQI